MKLKYLLLKTMTLFMALYLTSCTLEPYIITNEELYTRNFIKKFGLIDPNQDFNLAQAATVNVNVGDGARSVKVYVKVESKYYLVANLTNVAGKFDVPIDIPEGCDDLMVKVDGHQYTVKAGGNVDASVVGSRGMLDGSLANETGTASFTVTLTKGDPELQNAEQLLPILAFKSFTQEGGTPWTKYYSVNSSTWFDNRAWNDVDNVTGLKGIGILPEIEDGVGKQSNFPEGNVGRSSVINKDFKIYLNQGTDQNGNADPTMAGTVTILPMYYHTGNNNEIGIYMVDGATGKAYTKDGEDPASDGSNIQLYKIYSPKSGDEMQLFKYDDSYMSVVHEYSSLGIEVGQTYSLVDNAEYSFNLGVKGKGTITVGPMNFNTPSGEIYYPQFTSNNTGIATVDESGNVTGVSAGSTTITVSVEAVPGYTFYPKDLQVTVSAGSGGSTPGSGGGSGNGSGSGSGSGSDNEETVVTVGPIEINTDNVWPLWPSDVTELADYSHSPFDNGNYAPSYVVRDGENWLTIVDEEEYQRFVTAYINAFNSNKSSIISHVSNFSNDGVTTECTLNSIERNEYNYRILKFTFTKPAAPASSAPRRHHTAMSRAEDQVPWVLCMPSPAANYDSYWVDCTDNVAAFMGLSWEANPTPLLFRSRPITIKVEQNGRPFTGAIGTYLKNSTATVFSESKYNSHVADKVPTNKTNSGYIEPVFSCTFTHPYSGRDFMGMEDWIASASDMDLNDIVFTFRGYSKLEGSNHPKTPDEPLSWIVAAEDLGTTDDFDFNDIVFKLTCITVNGADSTAENPTFEKSLVVQALAAGGTKAIYLHFVDEGGYDWVLSPNNRMVNTVGMTTADAEECEWHRWFGNFPSTKMINTSSDNYLSLDTKYCQITESMINYTLSDFSIASYSSATPAYGRDAMTVRGFYITVDSPLANVNGMGAISVSSTDNTTVIYNKDAGIAPQMFLIPNYHEDEKGWKWPDERTSIFNAYPKFGNWVTSSEDTWYKFPSSGVYRVIPTTNPATTLNVTESTGN